MSSSESIPAWRRATAVVMAALNMVGTAVQPHAAKHEEPDHSKPDHSKEVLAGSDHGEFGKHNKLSVLFNSGVNAFQDLLSVAFEVTNNWIDLCKHDAHVTILLISEIVEDNIFSWHTIIIQ